MSYLLQATGDRRVGVSRSSVGLLMWSLFVPLAQAQPAPVLPPLAAEVTVPADAPFGRLAALARLADVVTVLDASRAPLRRGRIDLLRKTAGVFGVRFRAAPTAGQIKLLRLLRPSLLVFEVATGAPLEPLVSAAQSVGGASYRFELADAPGADQQAILRRLRPLTLRFPWTATTPKAVAGALGAFPGRVDLVVAEGAPAQWLAAQPWPRGATLVIAPAGGNYVDDATLSAILSAGRVRHVVKVSLPLRRVEAEQLRRLADPSLELDLRVLPAAPLLRTLPCAQGHRPWPAAQARSSANVGYPTRQVLNTP